MIAAMSVATIKRANVRFEPSLTDAAQSANNRFSDQAHQSVRNPLGVSISASYRNLAPTFISGGRSILRSSYVALTFSGFGCSRTKETRRAPRSGMSDIRVGSSRWSISDGRTPPNGKEPSVGIAKANSGSLNGNGTTSPNSGRWLTKPSIEAIAATHPRSRRFCPQSERTCLGSSKPNQRARPGSTPSGSSATISR